MISIVIPVFNEEQNLRELYAKISSAIDEIDDQFEIIFVDDGSTDRSFEVLNSLLEDERISVIRLARNFGQTAAIAAGIDLSRGDTLLTMDADLQNVPGEIKPMWEAFGGEADMVVGWRKNRHDRYLTRILPSKAANYLIRKITGVQFRDVGCGLRIFKKSALEELPLHGDMHRLLPVHVALKGKRVTQIEVAHDARAGGTSKYGLSRSAKIILDLLMITFSEKYFQRPLYLFGTISLAFFAMFVLMNIFIVVRKVAFGGIWLSPLFFLAFLFLAISINGVFLGIVCELVVRHQLAVLNQRQYHVAEVLGPARK